MKATLTTPPPPRSTPATRAANTSHTPYTPPFTINIDVQEKAAFPFAGLRCNSRHDYRPIKPRIQIQHMKTGDYSAKELLAPTPANYFTAITIERKSIPDLFGSLAGKDGERRRRFKEEHERMQQEFVWWGGFAHVVIEGSLDDAEAYEGRGASVEAVLSAAVRWPRRYGVHWHWAGSRTAAEKLTYRLIADAWDVFEKRQREARTAERNAQIEALKNLPSK